MAPSLGYLWVFPPACYQRICRGALTKSLRDTPICARVPRSIWFGRVCWARLPEKHPA